MSTCSCYRQSPASDAADGGGDGDGTDEYEDGDGMVTGFI